MDWGTWQATFHRVSKSQHNWSDLACKEVFWKGENEPWLHAGGRSRKRKTENVHCISGIEVTSDCSKSSFRRGMELEGRLGVGVGGGVWKEKWQQKLRNPELLVPWLSVSKELFKPNQGTQIYVFKALSLSCQVNNGEYFFHVFGEVLFLLSTLTVLESRYELLLLLCRFSHVRLCATPETAAHQAPPSLQFSRQEHWSGLPFPYPVHETEKSKWSRSVVSDS